MQMHLVASNQKFHVGSFIIPIVLVEYLVRVKPCIYWYLHCIYTVSMWIIRIKENGMGTSSQISEEKVCAPSEKRRKQIYKIGTFLYAME